MSDFDTNGDLLVDAGELADAWGWTVEKAQSHIDHFDKDGEPDGKINAHEAAYLMTMIESNIAA